MKKTALVLAGLFLLVGCKSEFDGPFRVFQNMDILDKDGDRVQLDVGVYEAEAKADIDDNELELKIEDVRGHKVKLKWDVDYSRLGHFREGEYRIEPRDGSRYSVLARITVERGSETPIVRLEPCYYGFSYYRHYRGIYPYPWYRYPYPYYHGYREVESIVRTEYTNLDLKLVDFVTGVEMAEFHGRETDRDTEYTRIGPCYPY